MDALEQLAREIRIPEPNAFTKADGMQLQALLLRLADGLAEHRATVQQLRRQARKDRMWKLKAVGK